MAPGVLFHPFSISPFYKSSEFPILSFVVVCQKRLVFFRGLTSWGFNLSVLILPSSSLGLLQLGTDVSLLLGKTSCNCINFFICLKDSSLFSDQSVFLRWPSLRLVHYKLVLVTLLWRHVIFRNWLFVRFSVSFEIFLFLNGLGQCFIYILLLQ